MKHTLVPAVLALLASSCASLAPITRDEECAAKGMVLQGVGLNSGSGVAYDFKGNYAQVDTYSETVSCRVPANDIEACTVGRTREVAAPKFEYNDGIGGKRFITGMGYFVYILPGVIAKIAYDESLNSAVKRSDAIRESSKDKCKVPTPSRETAAVN